MDAIFRALADPSRRRLLDRLRERNGQSLRDLCEGLGMARQSVSKHLAVLEEAGLVTTVWHGRQKLHHLNAAPINDIAERWINRYDRHRVEALSDLRRALEDTTMDARFVYTTYINATPEHVWRGLTDPAFTRRYWGTTLESDWAVGSPITWEQQGVRISDPDQVVLESDPYHRLAYTWHTCTPQWAAANGIDDALLATLVAEGRSRVSFTIEPVDDLVQLTVVHEAAAADSTIIEMVSGGWPRVISALKTLLETDEVIRVGLPGRG